MTIGTPTYYPASPVEIRDGTYDRVMAIAAFNGNVFLQRTTPTKDEDLPLACIWHAGERTSPNGDANVGAPSFDHELTLIIDVMADATDEASLDTSIVNLVETVRATLLTDLTWVNLFEGIEKIDARYSYPKETEFFFVQGMIELSVTFRSTWEPYLGQTLDDLETTYSGLPGQPIQSIDLT